VVVVDRAGGKLRYASAGHPPAYLLRPGEPIRLLPATGSLLGIPGATGWETVALDVRPGDRLVMVTDGLMDQPCSKGGRFGIARLEAAIEEGRAEPLERLCQIVMHGVDFCRMDGPPGDDVTMLAAEF